MLKIKENVDLKELKKFGFKKDDYLSNDLETIYSVTQEYQKLCLCWKEKILYLYEPFNSNTFLLKADILYDLINSGLVEKVGDKRYK